MDTYILDGIHGAGKTKETFSNLFICCKKKYDLLWMKPLEKYNINSFVVFTNDPDESKKLNDTGCIRFYQYRDCILSIPYLFINSIEEQDVFLYAIQLLKKYGISTVPPQFFEKSLQPNLRLSTLFLKWTVNSIGRKIVEHFCDENALSIRKTIKRSETFYKIAVSESNLQSVPDLNTSIKLCDKMNNADIELCQNLFSASFSENYKSTPKDPSDISAENLSDMVRDIFTAYAFRIKEEDEKRSKTQTNRCIGIRVEDVINSCVPFINEQYYELSRRNELFLKLKQEVMAMFIESWDSGVASYDFASFKDKNNNRIISCFTKNGEQVFRLIYERFQDVYQYYYVYSLRTFITDFKELKNFGEYLGQVFAQDANMQHRIELFNSYMGLNSGYCSDVYVVEPLTISEQAFEIVDEYLLGNIKNNCRRL